MLTLGLRAVTCLVTQQHHVIMLRQGARRGHRVKLMECWTSVSCSKPAHLPSIPWTLICQAVFFFSLGLTFPFRIMGPGICTAPHEADFLGDIPRPLTEHQSHEIPKGKRTELSLELGTIVTEALTTGNGEQPGPRGNAWREQGRWLGLLSPS